MFYNDQICKMRVAMFCEDIGNLLMEFYNVIVRSKTTWRSHPLGGERQVDGHAQ